MAVKTTKIQCNQDVDVRGKVDIEGKVSCGGDAEVDGAIYAHGKDVTFGKKIGDTSDSIFKGVAIDYANDIRIGYINEQEYAFISFSSQEIYFGAGSQKMGGGKYYFSASSLADATKRIYRHSLTLTCGTTATYYIDYYSKNSLIVDSIQDLSTITGKHSFGCGSAQATFTSNVWKIGENAITAVADDVHAVTD